MTLDQSAISLEGRVALVTGAARGIGKAVAETFAVFGADVALCDRDAQGLAGTVREIEALGRRAFSECLDVREGAAVRAFVEGLAAETGRIDILVNNAGGGFWAEFMDLSENGQEALIRENFTSVTHFVRAVVPFVPERGGSIINLSSIEAQRAAPGFAVYAAMKAAVENLRRSLALELGSRRIRVNAIAPDAVPTPGISELGDQLPKTPLACAASADDVAGAALYLASDLSRFVTGTTLPVDGGLQAAGGWRPKPDGGFEL